jgi:hypothetical protein
MTFEWIIRTPQDEAFDQMMWGVIQDLRAMIDK